MGSYVVITRTTTNAGGMQEVYFVSPDMPAKRLEGMVANTSPEAVRRALLDAIAQRARGRYRVLHRPAGAFDIYIVADRSAYLTGLGALLAAAALLVPLIALVAAQNVRRDLQILVVRTKRARDAECIGTTAVLRGLL